MGNLISSTTTLPPVTIDGGVESEQKDVVDQPHKKENLISSSSSSSSSSYSPLANPKETMPVMFDRCSDYEKAFSDYYQPGRIVKDRKVYKYPTMTKVLGDFKLSVIGAKFTSSEIIVTQSKYSNTGKSTFLRLLAGLLKPDTVEGGYMMKMPQFNVSYMPPEVNPVSTSTVRDLLEQRITDAYNDPYFAIIVMHPLLIEQLLDQQVVNLSYGECQRVDLCLCLGKPADIYLIDEPTAYLDPKLAMAAVKAIRGFIDHSNKAAFVIEPHLGRADYMSDRVLVFQGKPTIHCSVTPPQDFFVNLNDEEWLIVEDGSYRGSRGSQFSYSALQVLTYEQYSNSFFFLISCILMTYVWIFFSCITSSK